MRVFQLSRAALSLSTTAVLLAACGVLQPPMGAPDTLPQSAVTAASSYQVLYPFRGHHDGDGAWPEASLINVNGTLYGTTSSGGAHNKGTVYSVTTAGTETVLYSFRGRSDGAYPGARLTNVNGMLYGTTNAGGADNKGTVYSVTTTGTEKVLYSFIGGLYGAYPSGLVNVKGTLYGTTNSGGNYECSGSGCGTVFSVTTGGTEKVLVMFGGGSGGADPNGGLISVRGTLYGTTYEGGHDDGTVFSVTTTGTLKVLHRFHLDDGAHPAASLINVKGTLYGTTYGGGAKNAGTVFSITTTGKEKVLHSFSGGRSDGAYPYASLINVNGTLYGTTTKGGSRCGSNLGCGTVFSVTTTGTEKVVHSFRGGTGGADPLASLINVNGTLYGTTYTGGSSCSHSGCGTVFALTP